MRMKLKKRKNFKRTKYIIILIVVAFIMKTTYKSLKKFQIDTSNSDFLKNILFFSNHYVDIDNNFISKGLNYVLNIDSSVPTSLVLNNVIKEVDFMVNIDENLPAKVYIYSSHQSEEYIDVDYSKYKSGVTMASNLLKESLVEKGIDTVVESADFVEFMRINNYTHAYSYVASRYFIEPVIRKNNFELIIDLHRDSNSKRDSTIVIDDKSYAKVLFVIGLENDNYNLNLKLTETINNMINSKYPGLSRGIYKKEGPLVDGVYNQDLNSKMILLELGGYQNTTEEVKNTIEVISIIIKEYMESI